jgi:amino acid transporter
LYVSLQIVTQGLLKADLAGTRTPIADAAGVLLPIARTALLLTACVSMLGFLMGNLLASSRLLFALGRDGYLPKALGSLDSRYHVPRTALILHAIGGTLLALGGNFESLATMSGGANCMVYALVCAAAWKLQASNVQEHGTPFRLPLGPVVPLISIGIMAAILLTLPLTEWKAIATWLAALIVLYFGLHMARRSTRTPVN